MVCFVIIKERIFIKERKKVTFSTFPNRFFFFTTVILVPKPLTFFFFGRISVLSVSRVGENKIVIFIRRKYWTTISCKSVSEVG